jgi:hypothetical protein
MEEQDVEVDHAGPVAAPARCLPNSEEALFTATPENLVPLLLGFIFCCPSQRT